MDTGKINNAQECLAVVEFKIPGIKRLPAVVPSNHMARDKPIVNSLPRNTCRISLNKMIWILNVRIPRVKATNLDLLPIALEEFIFRIM
jgi:hypothetical protein